MLHSYLNHVHPCEGIPIGSTAGARSSDWINLANYRGAVFLVTAEIGAAGDDIVLSLRQAKTNAGGSAKALDPKTWYHKSGASIPAIAQATKVSGATLTIEGSQRNLAYVEIDAAQLDVSDDFKYVQLQHDNGGAAGKLLGCVALAVGPRFMTDPTELPSAVA